jgi:hypothetical protein
VIYLALIFLPAVLVLAGTAYRLVRFRNVPGALKQTLRFSAIGLIAWVFIVLLIHPKL